MAVVIPEELSLVDNLSALLESGDGADVTLAVGDSVLMAHSLILTARSPVFAAMLKRDMREAHSRHIEIADVGEEVLKQLLHFIYTDTAPQLDSMAAELLSASDKYDLPLLKKRCEQALVRGLTVDNAAAIAVLAEMHSCPLLKSAAADFIATHPLVMATEGWKNAMRNNVDVTAEICSLVAVASSKKRVVLVNNKVKTAQRLIEAAKGGRAEEVRGLLLAGAPVNARDGSGFPALHQPVRNGRGKVVKHSVYAGADVNVRNSSQQTPLHYASHKGILNAIRQLLGHQQKNTHRMKEHKRDYSAL